MKAKEKVKKAFQLCTVPLVAATMAFSVPVIAKSAGGSRLMVVSPARVQQHNVGVTNTLTMPKEIASIIKEQPVAYAEVERDSEYFLSVTAEAGMGGELSYAWYMAFEGADQWSPIAGANESTYKVPSDLVRTYDYYVEVTESLQDIDVNQVNSERSTIKIVKDGLDGGGDLNMGGGDTTQEMAQQIGMESPYVYSVVIGLSVLLLGGSVWFVKNNRAQARRIAAMEAIGPNGLKAKNQAKNTVSINPFDHHSQLGYRLQSVCKNEPNKKKNK